MLVSDMQKQLIPLGCPKWLTKADHDQLMAAFESLKPGVTEAWVKDLMRSLWVEKAKAYPEVKIFAAAYFDRWRNVLTDKMKVLWATEHGLTEEAERRRCLFRLVGRRCFECFYMGGVRSCRPPSPRP